MEQRLDLVVVSISLLMVGTVEIPQHTLFTEAAFNVTIKPPAGSNFFCVAFALRRQAVVVKDFPGFRISGNTESRSVDTPHGKIISMA